MNNKWKDNEQHVHLYLQVSDIWNYIAFPPWNICIYWYLNQFDSYIYWNLWPSDSCFAVCKDKYFGAWKK